MRTEQEVKAIVEELTRRITALRLDLVGSIEIGGEVADFRDDYSSVALANGELVVNIRADDIVDIRGGYTSGAGTELATGVTVRVKSDARVVMESAVDAGLIKGLVTGQVFMEVSRPGATVLGRWCDTHWCCRGACWCGIGECGASESNYVPGSRFRQAVLATDNQANDTNLASPNPA